MTLTHLFAIVWIGCGCAGLALDLLLRRQVWLNATNRVRDLRALLAGLVLGWLLAILMGPFEIVGVLWLKKHPEEES